MSSNAVTWEKRSGGQCPNLHIERSISTDAASLRNLSKGYEIYLFTYLFT